MKNWKVLIEYNNKFIEVEINAESYADAYIQAELEYPGCKIKSIAEIRNPNAED